MKKLKGNFVCFLLLSFVLTFITYCKSYTNEQNSLNNNTRIEEKKSNITSETAVYIAKGLTVFDYDLRRCEPLVTEQSNGWFVDFKPKEENQNCPSVWIDKETGKILRANFPK